MPAVDLRINGLIFGLFHALTAVGLARREDFQGDLHERVRQWLGLDF